MPSTGVGSVDGRLGGDLGVLLLLAAVMATAGFWR